MCDLESNSSIRNPGPIDWIHYHVPRATLDSLTDDARVPRVKRLHCVYGSSDPILYHLTQLILPCLDRPEMFSSVVRGFFHLDVDLFAPRAEICSDSRSYPANQRGSGRRGKGAELWNCCKEHLDGEVKIGITCRGV